MAFTSYVTDEEAQEYIDVFHNGETVDEAALVRASYTLDRIYRSRFIGAKTDPEQEHEWPRNESEVVPDAVKQAVIELAINYKTKDFDAYEIQPGIVSKTEAFGPFSESTTYKPETVFRTSNLTKIDAILGGLITASTDQGGIWFARLAKAF